MEHVNDDRREGAYVEGERDGQWIHLDAEGQVVFEGRSLPDSTGEHVGYWPTGIREWVGSYKGGLRDVLAIFRRFGKRDTDSAV